MSTDKQLSPGEARKRVRRWRQWVYLGVGALAGGLIGFFTGLFDQGDGNLFAGDIEELSLPPGVAILIAIGLAAAFIALPLWGFRMIDDYNRRLQTRTEPDRLYRRLHRDDFGLSGMGDAICRRVRAGAERFRPVRDLLCRAGRVVPLRQMAALIRLSPYGHQIEANPNPEGAYK